MGRFGRGTNQGTKADPLSPERGGWVVTPPTPGLSFAEKLDEFGAELASGCGADDWSDRAIQLHAEIVALYEAAVKERNGMTADVKLIADRIEAGALPGSPYVVARLRAALEHAR